MKVICSWCGKDLGEKEPFVDNRVSHGICEDCRKKIMEGMKREPLGEHHSEDRKRAVG